MDPINQTISQQPVSELSSMNNTSVFNTQLSSDSKDGKSKRVGPIIVALIIVLLLVIAALYIFASRIEQQTVPTSDTATAANTVNENQATIKMVTPVTNTADDLNSLQNDLDASMEGVDVQAF